MPNDVFQANDAVLVLGVDNSDAPEGQTANDLISQYDLSNIVGRLRNVTLSVATDLNPFFEIGRRYAVILRPGKVYVSGVAERAHINGAFLRLLLGDGAQSPPSSANFVQPTFNMVTTLSNPALPDQFTRVTVFGVKFEAWNYHILEDDFVVESVKFQAIRIAHEEA
jgi:hypothetical protein